jgi:hypothetical protein
MRTKLFELMRKRLEGAYEDRTVWSDMAWALGKLIEGDRPLVARDRVATIHDLQRQAEAAGSTMNPQAIKGLVAKLRAFLDEELAEAASTLTKARRGKSEAGTCESCGHSLADAYEDAGGGRVCRGCGNQVPIETESDDDELYMPYRPVGPITDESEDESEDEVQAVGPHHRSPHRRKESRAVRAFRRTLRGDAPRVNRHLTPTETFAAMCPVPPRASASPRQPSAAAVRFQRHLAGTAERDRVDRMVAAGKEPADIFKALMSR